MVYCNCEFIYVKRYMLIKYVDEFYLWLLDMMNMILVKAKLTPNYPAEMDMIKIIERYGPFLRRAEDNNDDGKRMVRWAAFNEIKDGPHCSWAPMGGRGAARNLSSL